jgi:hypothetical protein
MNRRIPDYKKYIRQKIEILKQEAKLIKPLVTAHPPTVGAFYEMILRKFLKDFVPNKYKISTGFVVDIEPNNLSRQIDILIYENDTFPPIYQHEDLVIVESSAVYAAIEVKGQINSGAITLAKENMETFKKVTYPFTNWYLIVIDRANRKETILRYYNDLGNCHGLLVLDKYYIEGGKLFPNDEEATPATEVFLNNFLYHLTHPTLRPQPKIVEYR